MSVEHRAMARDLCAHCGKALPTRPPGTPGRKPDFCGPTCRKQAANRRRKDRDAARIAELEDEVRKLTRWKAEAIGVIAGWEEVWEAAGRPGDLGETKSVAVRRAILDSASSWPVLDRRPHSRACGIRQHPHGPQCARDCPTCVGLSHGPVRDEEQA